jgi:hypothetical protein
MLHRRDATAEGLAAKFLRHDGIEDTTSPYIAYWGEEEGSSMACFDREPPLSQMLDDPLTRALMASDGVDPRELHEVLNQARQRIAAADPDARRGKTRAR